MAYGIVLEFTNVGREQYDAVNQKLGIDSTSSESDWPAGLISHGAGPLPGGGWIVTEIWESKAAHEAFMGGRLGAALAAVGIPAPTRVTESDLLTHQLP